MDGKEPRVVFANAKMEQEFERLSTTTDPEGRRTYLVLQDIRKQLGMKCRSGKEIPEDKIPDVYKRLFQVSNLWILNLPPHGRVLYSLVDDEIRIVDVV